MKRTPLERSVGLARGPVRLSRRAPLRVSSARIQRRVSEQTRNTAGKAPQPAQDRRTPLSEGGWPGHVRDAVSSRSKDRCEMGLPDCTGTATDLHHRKRRREGDHTTPNALHVCRGCHQHAHTHPAEAREHGWIVSFTADPGTVPAVVRARAVWLTDDGRYVGEVIP